MSTAVAKLQDSHHAVAKTSSKVIDAGRDAVLVRVDLTDALLGAIFRGTADHIIVSIVGSEWTRAVEKSQRANLTPVE